MLHKLIIIQILLGAVSLGLPAPTPAPVVAGDIILARPKNYDNPMPRQGKVGYHPAVALTNPDEHGNIKVAPISHDHPMNPPTVPISQFNINLPPSEGKGIGTVNVATPATVHVGNVKLSKSVTRVEPHHLEALKAVIRKTCGDHVVRRSNNGHLDP
ncbi:hypothetical protein CVT25_009915 [Psilocybe cyanescens]|uniref:Uncharacterized protein n=1 Tax=Psilocybe cyanescens TaxID=93625 RepID=A0A409XCQ1_PSICY|nr:hypothetical protein CVT25_009915 [Psilocybe cyanescens]